ncbi:hypothetical protein Tco_0899213 [Tanacetum coccineum]
MPPRMTTRSAGRGTAAPRGEGTGGRVGRGGGRGRGPRRGNDDQVNELGGQGNDQDIGVGGGGGEVPDFATSIAQQLQSLLPTIIAQVGNQGVGCTYKEFLACNPKECDGKGGAVVYTLWIKKMESVQDMSGCGHNQKVKYSTSSFFGKALTWWNSQIRTLGREVAVGMS